MKKLNYFIKKDSRIKKVYDYAKKKYLRTHKPQHNWEHILRDLYRALVIAQTEDNVDYNILIPATTLHDIGVTETDDYPQHAEVGSKIVKRDLPDMGYNNKEIEQIANCVLCHKDTPKPTTLEGKILYDADKLEKCGIGGIFSFYRAQQELNNPINKWIERAIKKAKQYSKNEFFTKKAKEICGNGFNPRLRHFEEVKDNLKERKDWIVIEEDLWD